MKKLIREWLGLDHIDSVLTAIYNNGAGDRKLLYDISQNTRISVEALSKVLAKLDPMYGKPEIDPARKAEDWARRHTLGEV